MNAFQNCIHNFFRMSDSNDDSKTPASQQPAAVVLKIGERDTLGEALGCLEDDFTVYFEDDVMRGLLKEQRINVQDDLSIDAKIEIYRNGGKTVVRGRALIARCHEGGYYSVTVRDDKTSTHDGKKVADKVLLGEQHPGGAKEFLKSALEEFGVKTASSVPKPDAKGHLYGFDAVIDALSSVIFDGSIQTGLIVIAGTTGCGKSNITRGLIHDYLLGIDWSGKRRPHLVTIEDPVETKARQKPPLDASNRAAGWDYTPRLLKVDVKNLKQALRDAKRMKPAMVFVGETRETRDWKEVVDFAGSGHLIITTTHASSLVETVQRIFRAVEALTPAGRGAAAQSLLAAIHLEQIMSKDGTVNGVVPAVWKRSTSGSLGLVSDGLASILPGNPRLDDEKKIRGESSLGRHWFAGKIKQQYESISPEYVLTGEPLTVWQQFAIQAAARDLVTL